MAIALHHIRHSHLLGNLADDEVRQLLAACQTVFFQSGQSVCHQGDCGESMFVIVSGRVRIDVDHGAAGRQVLNHLGPGDHFGEMSLLMGHPRSAHVTAVMDTQVLELARPAFERTLASVPSFSANLSRSLGSWLRGQMSGGRRRPERMNVALVRGCPTADKLAAQIAGAVASAGGVLQVLSDQPAPSAIPDWHQVHAGTEFEKQIMQRLAAAVADNRRTLVEINPQRATASLLRQQELIWWVADANPNTAGDSTNALSELLDAAPQLLDRVQLVWIVPSGVRLPECPPLPHRLTRPAIRVQTCRSTAMDRFRTHDVARLVHQFRGIQIGIALGGGGARGMAHLGVLEVCEREGVYFDQIAGTSAGAMIAAGYAAGIPLETILRLCQKEMTPSGPLRRLPRSRQWYLLAAFRWGLLEAKFRRYLHDYTFEQLLLPAHTVSVDLISGEHRVRSSGDVVRAVLESINHPVFGRPILRDGEALVDGGVLMNVPVTVLRQQDVDFTVAVDIAKKLDRTFAGNSKNTPTNKMRSPGYIATLLRVTDIEQKNLATLHGSQCDYLIAPDTGAFAFDDFSQGEALVEAGRRAAEEALPELKKMLAERLKWDNGNENALPATVRQPLPHAA